MVDTMVNSYPVSFLECCTRHNIPSHSKVLTGAELGNGICVHIPEEFASDIYLYGLHEIEPCDRDIFITEGLVARHGLRPWLDIDSCLLDISTGFHVYRLDFIHKHTNDIVNMYFSYYLQNSHPDKPYVYMEHDEE